jgi:hypothetical protein
MYPLSILDLSPDFILPVLVFAIPILAIVGGITAGIVRTLGQQRLIELAQRERIAAIERGLDVSKLPPLSVGHPIDDLSGMYLSPYQYARRRSQNLMIGGFVTLATGFGLALFLRQVANDVWAVGLIPGASGLALLISGFLVRPRESDREPGPTPRAS